MADNLDNWISPAVNQNVLVPVQESAFEKATWKVEMSTESEYVPIAAANSFKGYAAGQTIALNDTTEARVQLTLVDLCSADTIPAAKMNDSLGVEKTLVTKQSRMLFDLAVQLDNAGYATTAAANGGTVPFNSVYRQVKAATPANVVVTAGALTFAHVSNAVATAENSDFANDIVIVAHVSLKGKIRSITDGDGRFVFADGGLVNNVGDTLFGYPVIWSRGLKTSAAISGAPTGNALLVVAPRQMIISGEGNLPGVPDALPGFAVQDSANGVGFLSNSWTVKACVRRALVVADTASVGIVEITAS